MESTAQHESVTVARALIEAENAADVERAVALFHPDATVNDATGPHVGVDELRAWQVRLRENHFNAKMDDPTLNGDVASFHGMVQFDEFGRLGLTELEGVWEITAENGKVRRFDFWFTPEAGAALQHAIEQASAN